MQSVSSRIWTRVVVSVSYDDNHYTTGTPTCHVIVNKELSPPTNMKIVLEYLSVKYILIPSFCSEIIAAFVCVYIYIYIIIHRQTFSLYHNTSVQLDIRDSWSWDWNPANFYSNRKFFGTATRKFSISKGIFNAYVALFFVFIYTLNGYRELNSFEEICIMRVATVNS